LKEIINKRSIFGKSFAMNVLYWFFTLILILLHLYTVMVLWGVIKKYY